MRGALMLSRPLHFPMPHASAAQTTEIGEVL